MPAQNEPHMRAALAGTAQHFERAVTDGRGHARHVAVSYVPDVEDGVTLGFLVHVADITHHKNDGEALRLRNAELDRRVAERTAELERANAELRREAEQRGA